MEHCHLGQGYTLILVTWHQVSTSCATKQIYLRLAYIRLQQSWDLAVNKKPNCRQVTVACNLQNIEVSLAKSHATCNLQTKVQQVWIFGDSCVMVAVGSWSQCNHIDNHWMQCCNVNLQSLCYKVALQLQPQARSTLRLFVAHLTAAVHMNACY